MWHSKMKKRTTHWTVTGSINRAASHPGHEWNQINAHDPVGTVTAGTLVLLNVEQESEKFQSSLLARKAGPGAPDPYSIKWSGSQPLYVSSALGLNGANQ
jgi:hypothetical protein